ncbi:MAG: hypothetical protein AAGG75_22785 [Bacteroidota bacterium]
MERQKIEALVEQFGSFPSRFIHQLETEFQAQAEEQRYPTMLSIGKLLLQTERFTLAAATIQHVFPFFEQRNDKREMSACLDCIGIARRHLGELQSAFELYEQVLAIELLTQLQQLQMRYINPGQHTVTPDEMATIRDQLAQLYEEIGKHDEDYVNIRTKKRLSFAQLQQLLRS